MAFCDVEDLVSAAVAGFQPDPLLLVSEWADRFRVLSSRASSEPGKWRTSRTPYLKGPMDSLSRLDPVQEVCIVAGAQLGKTESGANWIGATIDSSPGPMLCVQPTVDIAKRFSRQRITPLIEETPRLKEKIRPSRERDSGNTVLSKEYPGGILLITGANSGAGLRSMPIRDLFMDEIDAYPGDVDGEGDPVDLAAARTRTFSRRKILLTSTPTVAGESRIWMVWEQSDQRVYKVACPDCGHQQPLEWERIRYDPNDWGAAVTMACEGCGVLIEERHKPRMLAGGEWVALNPGAKIRGFHINSLYSPLGWFSWLDAAQMYEKSKGDDQRLRVFTNTVLGLPWQEKGEAPAWEALYRRREPYPIGIVPAGGMVLTAGVDVQRAPGRLEVEIVAWGPNMESWSVDYQVLVGDTGAVQESKKVECPWRELGKLLNKEWPVAGGGTMPISRMAVDSGDQTQVVYGWIRKQHDMRLMATKGRDRQVPLIGIPTVQDVRLAGKRLKGGIKLWNLGVSTGKRELYNWLRQESPLDPSEPLPRGWAHFPEYGEEYFKGLTAEEMRMTKLRGFPVWEWEKVRDRNEPLDCRVMARAALAALGADRWSDEQWKERAETLASRMKEKLKRKAPPDPPKDERVDDASADDAPAPRETKRGGWLNDYR